MTLLSCSVDVVPVFGVVSAVLFTLVCFYKNKLWWFYVAVTDSQILLMEVRFYLHIIPFAARHQDVIKCFSWGFSGHVRLTEPMHFGISFLKKKKIHHSFFSQHFYCIDRKLWIKTPPCQQFNSLLIWMMACKFTYIFTKTHNFSRVLKKRDALKWSAQSHFKTSHLHIEWNK